MSEQKQQQQHVNKKKTRERAQAFANAAQTQLTLKWITDDALINQTISVGLSGSNDKMNVTTAEQFLFRERENEKEREKKNRIQYLIEKTQTLIYSIFSEKIQTPKHLPSIKLKKIFTFREVISFVCFAFLYLSFIGYLANKYNGMDGVHIAVATSIDSGS